jgi:phosphatidylinositol glycan class O
MVVVVAIIMLMNDLTLIVFRFDEFVLVRQAIFLTIDTFGFSHFLPIFGLPFLVAHQYMKSKKLFILMRLSQVS